MNIYSIRTFLVSGSIPNGTPVAEMVRTTQFATFKNTFKQQRNERYDCSESFEFNVQFRFVVVGRQWYIIGVIGDYHYK